MKPTRKPKRRGRIRERRARLDKGERARYGHCECGETGQWWTTRAFSVRARGARVWVDNLPSQAGSSAPTRPNTACCTCVLTARRRSRSRFASATKRPRLPTGIGWSALPRIGSVPPDGSPTAVRQRIRLSAPCSHTATWITVRTSVGSNVATNPHACSIAMAAKVCARTTSLLEDRGHDRLRAVDGGDDDEPASAP
jgi:hypothetical protein